MCGIVWAGCGFGMILNRDNWQRFMLHAFDALVVKIDVGDFEFRWEAIGLHRESVIVRSDLDVAIAKIFDRLIATTMTEDELKCFSTEGTSQQLMTKTDSESGHA